MLASFSAALLGLPKLLNDSDIHAEYPADVDDENVSERGFQSTLPGEATRLCSALALFRASRMMSKVLDENYPAASSHDLSLQRIRALSDELDDWQSSLPSHLRLHFVQDKPSTNVVGSRAPLLVRPSSSYACSKANRCAIVPCLSLYSKSDPSSCGWFNSTSQSVFFRCRSRKLQQTYHPNRAATRRTSNVIFLLLE